MVEQLPVKELVVGSSPTRGAVIENKAALSRYYFYNLRPRAIFITRGAEYSAAILF